MFVFVGSSQSLSTSTSSLEVEHGYQYKYGSIDASIVTNEKQFKRVHCYNGEAQRGDIIIIIITLSFERYRYNRPS